jgi:hypothetical protein
MVTAPATQLPSTDDDLPYAAAPGEPATPVPPTPVPATAVAVPYFQWDNRDGGAMRVWMPVHRTGIAAVDGDPGPDRVPRPRRIA